MVNSESSIGNLPCVKHDGLSLGSKLSGLLFHCSWEFLSKVFCSSFWYSCLGIRRPSLSRNFMYFNFGFAGVWGLSIHFSNCLRRFSSFFLRTSSLIETSKSFTFCWCPPAFSLLPCQRFQILAAIYSWWCGWIKVRTNIDMAAPIRPTSSSGVSRGSSIVWATLGDQQEPSKCLVKKSALQKVGLT